MHVASDQHFKPCSVRVQSGSTNQANPIWQVLFPCVDLCPNTCVWDPLEYVHLHDNTQKKKLVFHVSSWRQLNILHWCLICLIEKIILHREKYCIFQQLHREVPALSFWVIFSFLLIDYLVVMTVLSVLIFSVQPTVKNKTTNRY